MKPIYLSIKRTDGEDIYGRTEKYVKDVNSLVSFSCGGKFACITTTLENIKKNSWEEDLDYEVECSCYHQDADKLL